MDQSNQSSYWDVFLAPLAMVLLPIGLLLWNYDLSLVEYKDWFFSLFDVA